MLTLDINGKKFETDAERYRMAVPGGALENVGHGGLYASTL